MLNCFGGKSYKYQIIFYRRIYDSIIKSILSMENQMYQAAKKIPNTNNNSNKSNGFEIFGFDIILDENLK
jgi:hypothetical protein